MKGKRSRKEVEVFGKAKFRGIMLYDDEFEVLERNAKLLGWSKSDYIGMLLRNHNADVNQAMSSLLSGVGE